MLTVNIPTKPYNEEKVYAKTEHTFNEGLTILVGQNGAGKTTILFYIAEKCKEEKIPLFTYDNYTQGGGMAMSKYGLVGDFTALTTAFCSSEGQRIYYNFSNKMESLAHFVRKNEGAEKVVITFDALDSGLDIANIADIKNFLEKTLINDIHKRNMEAYVLVSANNYAFVKGSRCYDVAKNKEITFNSYEEYEKFILERAEKRGNKNANS